ncbi:hypothetical protein [Embleya sp. NPDC059237]|uniref:hypothetical protein n=1 Tax=Embleya sp. NPDC059237 TaxID=3346784 RepID=UPI003685E68E
MGSSAQDETPGGPGGVARVGSAMLGVLVTGGGVAAAAQGNYLPLYVACGVLLLIALIVVSPAVWSRQPTRRKAAQQTLGLLLGRNTRPS